MYLDVYRDFIIFYNSRLLVIKDPETGEEAHKVIDTDNVDEIICIARSVIDERIKEKAKDLVMIEIPFILELRSGDRYSHSYLVPKKIVDAGGDTLKEYLLLEALGDKIEVILEG